ncbi:putative wall-associated receptor kinase-like 16 [Olea europaea var. sylvestris]|uniref:putative wall-associated receptor kinase-like 16 n=1 Tax=Olea europaea var. sylvestris TaxID=158386 RepID=UPI000C1D7227|nr:putative wall-associated receptor kinase-like 16 [Olea europaea var. sylvestris]
MQIAKQNMVMRYALLHMFFLLSLVVAPPSIATTTTNITKSGCQRSCGNVEIPYPFGIGPNCSMNSYFNIHCNTSINPPKPYLLSDNSSELPEEVSHYLEVVNISKSQIYVKKSELQLARSCYGMPTNDNTLNYSIYLNFESTPYTLSDENQLIAVGCDDLAIVQQFSDQIHNYSGIGCLSFCPYLANHSIGSCPLWGCCQTSISKTDYLNVRLVDMHTNWAPNSKYYQCSFATVGMIGDLGNFTFKLSDLNDSTSFLKNNKEFTDRPLVLDWRIGPDLNCNKTSCGEHSSCINLNVGNGGYHCRCKEGYEGNPYLGCQDIDECKNNPCAFHGFCNNTSGSYKCGCPDGYYGDGKINGTGCRQVPASHSKVIIGVGLGSGMGLLLLLSTSFWLYKFHKKRKIRKRKQKFFKRNGGLLLKQISSAEGILEKTRIFTSKELETATDHFNESRILGKGGQGTVYKGMLSDGKIVAIKKSISINENQVGQFINEVVMLSQVVHRNIVKLLGCCLETEVPLLVYEFISNGTLFNHIHDESDEFLFSWNLRLKIAVEVAEALAYLHSATSIPIYHRDIKSSNILLDEKYIPKVVDFGISMSIAVDQTHQTTLVKGTFGYLDPEYFQSSQFTEKSDVYSFGVVLIELLTGQRPISLDRMGEQRSLATSFLLCMEEENLETLLDTQVLQQGSREEIIAVAKVAQRCLNLNGKKRPNMKEVAMELESVRMSQTLSTTFETKYQGVQLHKPKSILVSNDDYTWRSTSDNTIPSSNTYPLEIYTV